ncbi:hypothetical protein [Kribbella sp. NPDC000426]|uniref:hypothetical protein n=1 Tax=Kribbella sp. NPDC000426 TaxID=3154255 RepID=UPI003318E11A
MAVVDTGLGASFFGYGECIEPLVGQLEVGMTGAGFSRSNLAAVVFTCTELLPGVHAVLSRGHTPGHSAVLLQSRGERLLCVGDTFYDPLQLTHPDWATPWDLDQEVSIASRRAILARAADEHLLIHAYHLPFPGLGHVERTAAAFSWHPVH